MSGSIIRPTRAHIDAMVGQALEAAHTVIRPPVSLREAATASKKASTADSVLFAAMKEAEEQIDNIDRTMFFRVNNGAPAANDTVLASIRRVANALQIAADEYEFLA